MCVQMYFVCRCSGVVGNKPIAMQPSSHLVVLLLSQLLGCIGEQFDDGDEICGVVVNVRGRGDRICLWTRTASNEAVQV